MMKVSFALPWEVAPYQKAVEILVTTQVTRWKRGSQNASMVPLSRVALIIWKVTKRCQKGSASSYSSFF